MAQVSSIVRGNAADIDANDSIMYRNKIFERLRQRIKQFHSSCAPKPNKRTAFAVVIWAISYRVMSRTSANFSATCFTKSGSLRLARKGCGTRYGLSVSTRTRSNGAIRASKLKMCAKHCTLHFSWRKHTVVIQPKLANRHDC